MPYRHSVAHIIVKEGGAGKLAVPRERLPSLSLKYVNSVVSARSVVKIPVKFTTEHPENSEDRKREYGDRLSRPASGTEPVGRRFNLKPTGH